MTHLVLFECCLNVELSYCFLEYFLYCVNNLGFKGGAGLTLGLGVKSILNTIKEILTAWVDH